LAAPQWIIFTIAALTDILLGVPQVFISYSHDSANHEERVLALAERLRKDGVDAQIDQYVAGTPQEGSPRWMLDPLRASKYPMPSKTDFVPREKSFSLGRLRTKANENA
jgi:hypothetical protein